MTYLNHSEIVAICEAGQMDGWHPECVNAASLDVRLGDTIMVERESDRMIDYRKRERMSMETFQIKDGEHFVLHPGDFILASTMERCNFADDTAALFRIKSSMGRIGLEHMDAGWVDPGFNGVLTLEFKNMNRFHPIILRPGDAIGQLVFLRGSPVTPEQSYRARGNYNGAAGPKQVGYR